MILKSTYLLRRNVLRLRDITPSLYQLKVRNLSRDIHNCLPVSNRNNFLRFTPSVFAVARAMSSEGVQDIDVPEYLKLKEDPKTVIIDVREKSEIAETGIIPGGYNIPLGDIADALQKDEANFEKAYSKKKPAHSDRIIFSCRSGKRSMMAAQTAQKLGYEKTLNLKGGWLAWEEYSKK